MSATAIWDDGPDLGTAPAPACAAGRVGHTCGCGGFVPQGDRPAVTGPEGAAALVLPRLHGADRERCVALLLDVKHRLLSLVTVSVGSVDHTFMSPREVLRDALLANAAAVVLAHNHPSGDPEPSDDDQAVTRRIARACEVVGVGLLDHLVVAERRWVSLARRGAL